MSEDILFAPSYADIEPDSYEGEKDRYVRSEHGIGSAGVKVKYESGRAAMLSAEEDEPVLVLKSDSGFVKATHRGKESIREVADEIGL